MCTAVVRGGGSFAIETPLFIYVFGIASLRFPLPWKISRSFGRDPVQRSMLSLLDGLSRIPLLESYIVQILIDHFSLPLLSFHQVGIGLALVLTVHRRIALRLLDPSSTTTPTLQLRVS